MVSFMRVTCAYMQPVLGRRDQMQMIEAALYKTSSTAWCPCLHSTRS